MPNHMKAIISALALIVALAWSGTARAQFLTAPHDDTNSIDCLDCHVIHSTPVYDYKTVEGNVNLCKSCHNEGGVGLIETHSPGGTDLMCSTLRFCVRAALTVALCSMSRTSMTANQF